MELAIGIGYWVGAMVFWLPLALMLRGRESAQGIALLMAGVLLAMVWPVSLPFVGGLFGARHMRRRPVDATEAALLSI